MLAVERQKAHQKRHAEESAGERSCSLKKSCQSKRAHSGKRFDHSVTAETAGNNEEVTPNWGRRAPENGCVRSSSNPKALGENKTQQALQPRKNFASVTTRIFCTFTKGGPQKDEKKTRRKKKIEN